jgi:hypothetical protein
MDKRLAESPTVEMKQPSALRPYARNARTHSKKQLRQIADSIERSASPTRS